MVPPLQTTGPMCSDVRLKVHLRETQSDLLALDVVTSLHRKWTWWVPVAVASRGCGEQWRHGAAASSGVTGLRRAVARTPMWRAPRAPPPCAPRRLGRRMRGVRVLWTHRWCRMRCALWLCSQGISKAHAEGSDGGRPAYHMRSNACSQSRSVIGAGPAVANGRRGIARIWFCVVTQHSAPASLSTTRPLLCHGMKCEEEESV
jgi:hypothetical protein